MAPIIWNRPHEAARASSLRTHVRLRVVFNALDAAAHLGTGDEFRTRMIALAKAFASDEGMSGRAGVRAG